MDQLLAGQPRRAAAIRDDVGHRTPPHGERHALAALDGGDDLAGSIAPSGGVPASECREGVAKRSDRALRDRAHDEDGFLDPRIGELGESAGDGLG